MHFNHLRRFRGNSRSTMDFEFKVVDGKIPILKYISIASREEDVFFLNDHNTSTRRDYGNFGFDEGGRVTKHQLAKTHGNTSWYGLYTGYFTTIVFNDSNIETINDTCGTRRSNNIQFSIENIDYDLLTLGVIELSKIRDIKFLYRPKSNEYRHSIEINEKDIIVLISKEKVLEREYLTKTYSGYFRTKIRKGTELTDYNVDVRIVNDSYLQSFIQPKIQIPTNSLSELKEIENSVVDKVFSKLSAISPERMVMQKVNLM